MKNQALLMFFASLMATQVYRQAEAKEVVVDAQVLEQLQQLLADQQKQLQKLQKQVDEFQQTATAAQTQAQEAKAVAEEAKSTGQTAAGKGAIVSSGQERVKLTVSGQLNKAVNVIDDGDGMDVYFVDNLPLFEYLATTLFIVFFLGVLGEYAVRNPGLHEPLRF